MKSNKAALLILDGWGQGLDPTVSAIAQGHTPYMDGLLKDYPTAHLVTYGEEVGLPEGQMGNSEVGHLNIGAGRIVFQELARINNAIKDGSLRDNKVLQRAIKQAKEGNRRIHLLGLLSDGGVHAHVDHIEALGDSMDEAGLTTYIHAFLDGRDTDPRSGIGHVKHFIDHYREKDVHLATVIGRYYAMDRDKRWERIKLAYDLLVHGKGKASEDILTTIQEQYDADITDEFMPAIRVHEEGKIQSGDTVLFCNFRTDRPRELTYVLTQKAMPDHDMKPVDVHFVSMTSYDDTYTGIDVLFTKENLEYTLGEVLSNHGRSQLRMAETEKYPHVTFFFSGGREEPFDGEKRIVVPSPQVATYDLQPEMSAPEVTTQLLAEITANQPDFICVNYANTDMVGHTGVFEAAVKAAETVDGCLAQVVPALRAENYDILIIADHGNADMMINPDGSPHTAHTTNLVPVIYIGEQASAYTIHDGKLGDIAPTILSLMDIDIPAAMTGTTLLTKNQS